MDNLSNSTSMGQTAGFDSKTQADEPCIDYFRLVQNRLLPHHIAELQGSGLSYRTIFASGCRSVTDGRIKSLEKCEYLKYLRWGEHNQFRFASYQVADGLLFESRSPAGDVLGYRLKPDRMRKQGMKYEQPSRVPSFAYFTPNFRTDFERDGICVVTEGEKKALACYEIGIPAIGLPGVWNFPQKRDRERDSDRVLIPCLKNVDFSNKKVVICFDTDPIIKSGVTHAAAELARLLTNDRGAVVSILWLPPGPRDENGVPSKMSIDDFLVANPPETEYWRCSAN